jgi:hypothetical protein
VMMSMIGMVMTARSEIKTYVPATISQFTECVNYHRIVNLFKDDDCSWAAQGGRDADVWLTTVTTVLLGYRKAYGSMDEVNALTMARDAAVAAEADADKAADAGGKVKEAAMREFEDDKLKKIRKVETELSELDAAFVINEQNLADGNAALVRDLGRFV